VATKTITPATSRSGVTCGNIASETISRAVISATAQEAFSVWDTGRTGETPLLATQVGFPEPGKTTPVFRLYFE
jgi:hypothetical protein